MVVCFPWRGASTETIASTSARASVAEGHEVTNQEAIRRRRKVRKQLRKEFPDCEYIGGVGWTGPGWRACEKREAELNLAAGLTARGLIPMGQHERLEAALRGAVK